MASTCSGALRFSSRTSAGRTSSYRELDETFGRRKTALRDNIGRTSLTDLLRGRERIEDELQQLIHERSNPGSDGAIG